MTPSDRKPSIDSPEHRTAARVRAALAYSGLTNEAVLVRMGGTMSEATLRRITSAARPRGASTDELWLIADACGVPHSWIEEGWESDPPEPLEVAADASTEERLDVLERYVGALLRIERRRAGRFPLPLRTPALRHRARRAIPSADALPPPAADDA